MHSMEAKPMNPYQTAPKKQSDLSPYYLHYRLPNIGCQSTSADKRADAILSLQCYSVLPVSDILVKNELCIPLERGSNVLYIYW